MVIQRKKLAIIGLGGQSRSELIPALIKMEDRCEIVAICDINEEFVKKTKELLPNFGKIVVYQDYKKLFNQISKKGSLKFDGIILSVPHFLHGEITKLAIKKGISVFKEKPFGISLQEATEISDLAAKEGVQVYTVTKRQFYPSYAKALELLSEKVIGLPYMYSARHFMSNGNLYEGWRSLVEFSGGGVLIDLGYHLLDVITRYFGEAKEANLNSSNVARPNYIYDVEDAAALNILHSNGVYGMLQIAALSGPKEESFEIRGTEGRMIVSKKDITTYDIAGEEINHHFFEIDSIDAVVEALDEFISDKRSVWLENISHNMKIMRTIDRAYKKT